MKPLKSIAPSGRTRSLTPSAISVWTIILIFLLSACIAPAASRAVTSLGDSGAGSFRQVIADSTGGDTIIFGVAGTITLTSGPLVISKNLTVLGPGAPTLIISGNKSTRVLYVNSNINLSLSQLTIANGLADNGGGIFNAGGTLIMHYCILTRNSAVGPSAPSYSGNPGTNGCGGAVYNAGTVNAINCTFVSNSVTGGSGARGGMPESSGGAGANGNGGAIGNIGTLLLTGCLLANNAATGFLRLSWWPWRCWGQRRVRQRWSFIQRWRDVYG